MSEFDPYHKWLGISADEQPPSHYRLLGVKPFESDCDVIQHAVDQRMVHLRTFQSSKHAEQSQRLLNEVAGAAFGVVTGPAYYFAAVCVMGLLVQWLGSRPLIASVLHPPKKMMRRWQRRSV